MKYLCFNIFLLTWCYANGQTTTQDAETINQKIDRYVIFRNSLAPINGAVLVTKGDQIISQHYFGYNDKENNVLIDSTTVFPIASSTKPFTATAIMLLYERKKLSLEDPVTKWIQGIPVTWRNVKIKDMLSHTSGIPDIFKAAGTDKFEAGLPTLVKIYKNAILQFTPGEQFNYSNANYIFLSYIIEKASGSTYENFLTENIIKPLHMNNTGFTYLYTGKNLAQPYSNVFQMNKVPVAELTNLKVLKGAGGLYSTTIDLSKFLNGLQKLLSRQSLERMWQPVKEDYGLGWHIQEQFGKMTIKHPGGINGYSSEMRYVPADSLSVIILSNVSANDLNIRYTGFDIMKLVNNRTLDIDTTINKALLGKYTLPKQIAEWAKSDFLEIKNKDGKMILAIPGMPDKYLIPFAKGKYFFYGEATNAEFEPDGQLTIVSPSMGRVVCVKQ